ncbi:MAG: DUF4062 domain-containing protein [Mesorhizobium sp.]|uniref:DUF4062 domain-containing protein n=1 Tax=Mesorhizobium sp. TaxID=1871066 RepID=UPI000FE57CFA|nr:DUF4062 domain-containing protein [Mesorhizobium sp.]RWP02515.1 MAG: DUF4062 domain-containing protein [Mesorhizobium sp.]TIM52400.1 MAG: DUF4062 domain-containing protein [Mesorhizobium sp.]
MSTRLRVFVSSTMKDLGDARRAVVSRLNALNLEPVNAERMHPDGGTSWEVLRAEIDSSHLFILISGEIYGWIPDSGPGAGEGRSVTHMEVMHAHSIGLPILPFFKRLTYDSPRDTADAKARDNFRREIADWGTGRFRQEFEWSDDLGRSVADSLLDLFQGSVLRELTARTRPQNLPSIALPKADFSHISIPAGFVGHDAVLFAGAGVSAPAGLPTAAVMIELFGARLSLGAGGDQLLARHRFADVAAALQLRFGRRELERTVVQAFDVVQGVVPTPGHLAAVSSFRHIVTTNYDDLFERAATEAGISHTVVHSNGVTRGDGTSLIIFQVDGSIASPGSLIITEDDAARTRTNGRYWDTIADAISDRPVVVVGHSLRDENARKVLTRRGNGKGLYLSLTPDPMDDIIRGRFGLLGCVGTANDFLLTFQKETRQTSAIST